MLKGKYSELKKLSVYDRYAARSRLLYGEVFYEGLVEPNMLKFEVGKSGEFVKDINESIKKLSGKSHAP
jgi:hypothetical protein